MTIINFKETAEVKRALRIAAVQAGHPNVSKFLSEMVRANPYVKKELKSNSKKVA